jgi:uncharacterized protein (DUF302 family)
MWYLEKETRDAPDEVVARMTEEAPKHNMRVLHVHDVTATLAEKGFELVPYRIVEVCGAKFAKSALDQDLHVGLMMPCRICVFRDGNVTRIATVKPTELMTFFPGKDLAEFGTAVEEILERIMEAGAS